MLDIPKCVCLDLGLRAFHEEASRGDRPRVVVFLQTDMVFRKGFLESLAFKSGEVSQHHPIKLQLIYNIYIYFKEISLNNCSPLFYDGA